MPLELVLSTACITNGEQMTLTVHTDPHVLASIVVNYADNDDHGQMENFQADADGTITWSWIIGGEVPPGDAFVLASAWDAAREKRSEAGVAEFTVAGPLGCP